MIPVLFCSVTSAPRSLPSSFPVLNPCVCTTSPSTYLSPPPMSCPSVLSTSSLFAACLPTCLSVSVSILVCLKDHPDDLDTSVHCTPTLSTPLIYLLIFFLFSLPFYVGSGKGCFMFLPSIRTYTYAYPRTYVYCTLFLLPLLTRLFTSTYLPTNTVRGFSRAFSDPSLIRGLANTQSFPCYSLEAFPSYTTRARCP